MKKIIKQMAFSLVLISTTSNAMARTIQEELQEQEKRDIKASGSRVGEKIAVGIGICILCYMWYSWRGDTWGLKEYRDKRIIKHGASADFVKERGSWMYRSVPKKVDELIGEARRQQAKAREDRLFAGDTRSGSLLNMAGSKKEINKGKQKPFKYGAGNMDGGNYPNIENAGCLSGNEVLVDGVQLSESTNSKKRRKSSLLPVKETKYNSIFSRARRTIMG